MQLTDYTFLCLTFNFKMQSISSILGYSDTIQKCMCFIFVIFSSLSYCFVLMKPIHVWNCIQHMCGGYCFLIVMIHDQDSGYSGQFSRRIANCIFSCVIHTWTQCDNPNANFALP